MKKILAVGAVVALLGAAEVVLAAELEQNDKSFGWQEREYWGLSLNRSRLQFGGDSGATGGDAAGDAGAAAGDSGGDSGGNGDSGGEGCAK